MKCLNIRDEHLRILGIVDNAWPDRCCGGYQDHDDCSWYHHSWPLLRYLGVVSNPYWHEDFYRLAIRNYSVEAAAIIGTADFTMPYLCSTAGVKNIIVTDKCETPVFICNDVALRYEFTWNIKRLDIMNMNANDIDGFNVIMNDAFITRFPEPQKVNLLKRIAALLNPGGLYITTIRIGKNGIEGYRSNEKQRNDFVDKAVCIAKQMGFLDINSVRIKTKTYIEKMVSYPIPSRRKLEEIVAAAGMSVLEIDEGSVEGESEESHYFRAVLAVRG